MLVKCAMESCYGNVLAPLLPRAGVRGGGDEGAKSTWLRLKLLVAGQSRDGLGGKLSLYMQFAKPKLRVFPHLIPRPLLLPWEEKGSYEYMGNPLQA
jgi:hypothetical protein